MSLNAATNTTRILKDNLFRNNPVASQIIGICSALAVTNNLINTFIMGVGVALSTAFSSFTLSLMKAWIPQKVRMIIQVLVLSFYVILLDILLRAFIPDIAKALGPYIGLIITNCILMGRAEAFAQANPPGAAFWDGLTSGIGYLMVLMIVAFFRELLGFGTLFGVPVLPDQFIPWTIMVMAPSAFFVLAIYIWIHNTLLAKKRK
ncbi:MAG TPA: Rnf-Nqr domain containing protein [Thermotogota bacterium]|jgi:Na+-transporting NADH:ubiquinone oxidoreductase subunit D|nr:MAG: Na(+)-translocating NADH-quinone reductase subunit D [Thermotogota bacterium ADurb.Bin062]HOD90302.1 Rnf-Nqr domain containing protein [Thermotogota bacterium]HQK80487.1 Rnf-Nqr domain containing protein [Thermotogota bacterium]